MAAVIGDHGKALQTFEWPQLGGYVRVATSLQRRGIGKGYRVILMLGNQADLWEAMLAVAKLGAVTMPTTGALGPADVADRITRGVTG